LSAGQAGRRKVEQPGPGAIVGRDGTPLTDRELDAWVDAFAVPDATVPMPRRAPSSHPAVTDHSPSPADRDARGNLVGDITLADGTVESVDALGAWADAFEVADPAHPFSPPTD